MDKSSNWHVDILADLVCRDGNHHGTVKTSRLRAAFFSPEIPTPLRNQLRNGSPYMRDRSRIAVRVWLPECIKLYTLHLILYQLLNGSPHHAVYKALYINMFVIAKWNMGNNGT
jgi:hypothetical protein